MVKIQAWNSTSPLLVSMIPILVPLFVSAFRRANDLAMAMEARCYRGPLLVRNKLNRTVIINSIITGFNPLTINDSGTRDARR